MGVLNHIGQTLPQVVISQLGRAWSAGETLDPVVEPVVSQAAGHLQLSRLEEALDLLMDGGIGPGFHWVGQ